MHENDRSERIAFLAPLVLKDAQPAALRLSAAFYGGCTGGRHTARFNLQRILSRTTVDRPKGCTRFRALCRSGRVETVSKRKRGSTRNAVLRAAWGPPGGLYSGMQLR